MNELITILNFISIYQGIFLGVILFNRKDNKFSNRILSIFLFISTLCSITISLAANRQSLPVYILTFFIFPLMFLYGPLIYFYIKSMTGDINSLIKKNTYHFIPSLLFFTVYLIINSFNKNSSFDFYYLKIFILVFSILIPLSIIIYSVLSWKILNLYSDEIENFFSNIEGLRVLWMKVFIGIILILFLYYGVLTWLKILHIAGSLFSQTFTIINSLFIVVTAFFLLNNPDIFKHTHKSLMELAESKKEMFEALNKDTKIKYERYNIDNNRKDEYQKMLLGYMKERKPYLEEDITLKNLAEELSIQPYHLSIIINERLHQNFFNFINTYRIEEVINKLSDPAESNKNILNIAFESGFNSKSSFNIAFKNITGMTPTEYKKLKK